MNDITGGRILIVEDEAKWDRIITRAIEAVLRDMGREADYTVMHAKDYQQALDLLKRYTYTLISMDINLSGVIEGKEKESEGLAEGLELLRYLEISASDTCSIIVSGADSPKHILAGLQKYNILRFIRKAPWDRRELKTTVKSILLYADARSYLRAGDWEQSISSWRKACEAAPELKKQFHDVGVLVEKAKLEAERATLAVTDPITGLPTGEAVESRLRELLKATKSWGILYVAIDNLEEYYETYGHVEGVSALKMLGRFLQGQAGEAYFIGYIGRGLFIVIVDDHLRSKELKSRLLDSFNLKRDMDVNLYPFQDRDKNDIVKAGLPELRLVVRLVSDQDGPFADIREISRMGSGSSPKDSQRSSDDDV